MTTLHAPAQPITETRTYAGRRLTSTGALAYFYADDAGELHGHAEPLLGDVPIGTRLEVTRDGGSVFVAGQHAPRVTGTLDDPGQLLQWIAQEKADCVAAARTREARRLAKTGRDLMREHLDPIRTEISKMSDDRRAATIWWIVQYLATGAAR